MRELLPAFLVPMQKEERCLRLLRFVDFQALK